MARQPRQSQPQKKGIVRRNASRTPGAETPPLSEGAGAEDIERLNALVRELRTENDRLARLAAFPQQAQKTFVELVERAPFGIYVVDSKFRIATMNAGSQNGAFRNVRPIIGRPFDEAIHILWPDAVAEEIIGRFRHTLDTGEPYDSPRFVNPRQDVGIVESYEWELHRIVMPDGQHGVICYYFDSTALRQVEHVVQRSKAELSFALQLNDALRQIDDPLQIQETAARLLGERLQADRVFYGEIIVEDGVETLVLERDYHRTGLASLSGRFAFKEFSHTDYEDYRAGRTVSSANVFTDQREPSQREAYRAVDVAAFVGVPFIHRRTLVSTLGVLNCRPRDWTPEEIRLAEQTADRTWHAVQRARAEEAVRAAKQRLDAHMDNSPLAVIEFDPEFTIIRWSREAERVFGWTAAEVTGVAIADLRWVYEDDVESVRQVSADMLEGRCPRNVSVNRNHRKDGTLVLCEWYNSAIYDVGGRLTSILAQVLDITERTKTEAALREANATLAEADRRKDDFIAILSHELRNPLAPIRYALPLLSEERLGEGGRRAVAVLDRQVAHLTRLVDDLLDVSRIAMGKIELRPEHVTLAAVLRSAVEAASPAIATARHSLDVSVPDAPIWLHVDAERISQAVTNLLNNSAKYTPKGGRIRLAATADEGHVVINVTDNGVGIAADALPALFEMFHQVSGGHKSQGGLGIGLALTKQLVELHGGTVEAHSPGDTKGAEFVIRLPLAALATSSEEQHAPAPCGQSACLRVLVVDDNVDLVDMLAMVVEADGHRVRKAFDGRSAISAALEYQPHLILLDVGMPDMDGMEVARELRRHAQLAGTRIVAVTGWGQAQDQRKTAEAGFDDHLTKPADPRQIQRLLEDVAQRMVGAAGAD